MDTNKFNVIFGFSKREKNEKRAENSYWGVLRVAEHQNDDEKAPWGIWVTVGSGEHHLRKVEGQ